MVFRDQGGRSVTEDVEDVEVTVTPWEAKLMRVGGRPFVYRPVGEKAWRLGWALPGVDVRAVLRPLEPVEFELRPKQRPDGMSAGAWQIEMDRQRGTITGSMEFGS
jgi:hypothetical protein